MSNVAAAIPRHLRTDLHLHTTFSDGRGDLKTMVATAQRIGFAIGISDHYSLRFGMQGDEALSRYLDALEQQPVYRAIELDLGIEHPVTPENWQRLDYCVGSMHFIVDDAGERVSVDRTSAASLQRYMDCYVAQFERGVHKGISAFIGHPTFLPDLPRDGQEQLWTPDYRARLIAAVVETGVALELSTRYRAPGLEIVKEALAAGARFAVASDGHGPEAIGAIDYPRRLIAELDIPADRFFLPARRLPTLSSGYLD